MWRDESWTAVKVTTMLIQFIKSHSVTTIKSVCRGLKGKLMYMKS